MKFNKTYLVLHGGITAVFFVLGIIYVLFVEGKTDKTNLTILFSVASALLVSFVVLYEEQRKRTNNGKKCATNDSSTVTYYVP